VFAGALNVLIERTGNSYSRPQIGPKKSIGRRPFWLPASSYYVLSLTVGLAIFFLLWGILHDGGEEMSWIIAGAGFGIFMIGAVGLREIILRRARTRYIAFEKRFDRQLEEIYLRVGENPRIEKLTIAKNERILSEIKSKSDAAKILNRLPDAHREVFEMCGHYLAINERELRSIGVGSPRLVALRKGKASVERRHRFHLLQWAQIETRNLTQEASSVTKTAAKVSAATNAISVIDSALKFYPTEKALLESHDLLREMLTSIRVSHFVEKAERSAFKGNFKQAKSLYRDALFYLGRDNIRSEQRNIAAVHINSEIEKLRLIEDGT